MKLFHPVFVHFPIAFYFLEAIFLILWVTKVNDEYKRSALLIFRLAFVSMLISLATGWIDSGGIKNLKGDVARHFTAALFLAFYQTGRAFLWRHSGKLRHRVYQKLQIASSAAGFGLVMIAAYLGGKLVYGS